MFSPPQQDRKDVETLSPAHDSPCLQKTLLTNKCTEFLFVFVPQLLLMFFSCSHFHLPIQPSSLLLSFLRFCRSSHDQARYPGNYLALSNKATTDSNEEWNIKEQRCLLQPALIHTGDGGRSESWGTCREATTTLCFPFPGWISPMRAARAGSRICLCFCFSIINLCSL